MIKRECCILDCHLLVYRREWCRPHYKRWRRHGDPLGGRRALRPKGLNTELEVFRWFMPGEPPSAEECWDWSAGTTKNGYGVMRVGGKNVCAHVVSYRIFNGCFSEEEWVLHECDRRICCQPAHLHLGTNEINMMEMVERGRSLRGEAHPNSKLNKDEVRIIKASTLSARVLAEQMEVHPTTIRGIRSGKSWRHVS